MVQTNIEYFNYNLKLFVNDIIKIFPDLETSLKEYYGEVLSDASSNEDKFIKRFMRKMGEHKTLISQKNEDLFKDPVFVLKGVDFKEVWISDEVTDSVKNSIWDYIQTLYVIGETIVSDSSSIKKLVENFKKLREDNTGADNTSEKPKESDETVLGDTSNTIIKPDSSDTSEASIPVTDETDTHMLEMLKNLSEKTASTASDPVNEDLINNGLIGNLAKELAEDINLDDFNLNINENSENVNDVFSNLISGDNPMKFMNLIQNVGQKIQSKLSNGNIDQSKLVNEAQQMMGMLGNNNPAFDNLINKTKTEMKDANPPNGDNSSNPTRDRLRRKLEQRKKK